MGSPTLRSYWKAKYAGMTVSEARRLRELEHENTKLKKLLAEAELDKAVQVSYLPDGPDLQGDR